MENFIDAFKRNADGSWYCVRDVTLNGPSGRIQVLAGTTFHRGKILMGVDLASFLEDQAEQRRRGAKVGGPRLADR